MKCLGTGLQRGPRSEDIIHEQQLLSTDAATAACTHGKSALDILPPLVGSQSILWLRIAAAAKGIRPAEPLCFAPFLENKLRLIESTRTIAILMKRYWYNYSPLPKLYWQSFRCIGEQTLQGRQRRPVPLEFQTTEQAPQAAIIAADSPGAARDQLRHHWG